MQDGMVVDSGAYEELVARNEVFRILGKVGTAADKSNEPIVPLL